MLALRRESAAASVALTAQRLAPASGPETRPAPMSGAGCTGVTGCTGAPLPSGRDQNVRLPMIVRDQLPGWMPSAFSAKSHLHGCMNSVAPVSARLAGIGST